MRSLMHLPLPLCLLVIELALPTRAVASKDDSAIQNLETRISKLEKKIERNNKRVITDGFFTAAYARSDDDSLTENWGGIGNENDFGALSTFGIQMTFQINPDTKAVTQFIARGEEEWAIEAEWAYFSYSLADNLTLRMGRQKAPLYLLSEYYEVSYASPWLVAPDEVYGITGDSTYDGISLLYEIPSDTWETTVQGMWGNNSFKAVVLGDVSLNNLLSVNITSRSDTTTFRLGYAIVEGDMPAFSQSLPAMTNTAVSPGDQLFFASNEHTDIDYLSAGFVFDNGRWLVMSELVQLAIAGWFTDIDGAYVMTGHRFGKFLPHLTYSRMQNADPDARASGRIISSATGLPLPLPESTVGQIADRFLKQDQSTYTLGLRYELAHGMSAKAEWSHLTDFNGTLGQFRVSAPPTKDRVNIIKFGIDSVF
jgi:hypothetical protein